MQRHIPMALLLRAMLASRSDAAGQRSDVVLPFEAQPPLGWLYYRSLQRLRSRNTHRRKRGRRFHV